MLFHRLSDLFERIAEAQHDGASPKPSIAAPFSTQWCAHARYREEGSVGHPPSHDQLQTKMRWTPNHLLESERAPPAKDEPLASCEERPWCLAPRTRDPCHHWPARATGSSAPKFVPRLPDTAREGPQRAGKRTRAGCEFELDGAGISRRNRSHTILSRGSRGSPCSSRGRGRPRRRS